MGCWRKTDGESSARPLCRNAPPGHAFGMKAIWTLLAVLAAGSAIASPASAAVYWGNTTTGTVGRANLDGSSANHDVPRKPPGLPLGEWLGSSRHADDLL